MRQYKSKKKLGAPKSQHTSYKSWSPNRPEKALFHDDLAEQMMAAVDLIPGGSQWDKADVSGLSTSTLRNYRNGVTQRPQALSLQMIAHALGGKLVFIKEPRNRK